MRNGARLRVLHAIHDFLPRHRAGAEIYACDLCRALDACHDVTVLTAEYDPARPHGEIAWRVHDGLPVVEIVNNWIAGSFEETYRSPLITDRLARVLDAVQPDVVHVHSLLNLSFDLPALARARGIPVVATLHDYTLVCASGGQRVHRADDHLCETIDPVRCARCFGESPFQTQIAAGRVAGAAVGPLLKSAAAFVKDHAPTAARALAGAAARGGGIAVGAEDIGARLDRARDVFNQVDLFIAPSRSIAEEFVRLGVPDRKLRVVAHGTARSDPVEGRTVARGSTSSPRAERAAAGGPTRPMRIGYVGTLVWHKGVHVLVDAVRTLAPDAYELLIFGDSPFPDYASNLRRRAGGLPVRLMGAFDRADVADVFGQIDVLVVPSLWPENSPLVIREAFMCGVPVIAARIGGMSEIVSDGVNGLLFEARSTEDLANALRTVIDDRSQLDALRREIPAVKTMGEHAREWAGIYNEVIAKTPSARERADPGSMRVAAVVLNYRTDEDTYLAVRSLLASRRPLDDIVIVDNDGNCRAGLSAPPSVAEAPLKGAPYTETPDAEAPLKGAPYTETPDAEAPPKGAPYTETPDAEAPLKGAPYTDVNNEGGCRGVTRLRTGANLGFSGGMNVGIRAALDRGADAVLLVNSDAIVPPDCVERLERVLGGSPRAGIVGPTIVRRSDPETIDSAGIRYDRASGRMRNQAAGDRRDGAHARDVNSGVLEVDAVAGCVMLVGREVFDAIGLLDEDYFFSFEDIDFCLRAKRAGFSSAVVTGAVTYHEGSRSIGERSPDRLYFAARNHLLLAQRATPAASSVGRIARISAIVALNVGHALVSNGATLPRRLAAVVRGTRDYFKGRFGGRRA